MSDSRAIKDRLLSQVESVCSFLLPGGKIVGSEYRIGSTSGEAGKSLGIVIRGDKKGVWQDFSSGATGDIFELWMQSKNCNFREALEQARRFLGIVDIERPKTREKPSRPSIAGLVRIDRHPALEYLRDKRGINVETAMTYKVFGHGKGNVRADKEGKPADYLFNHNEHFLAFAFIDSEGDPVMIKSTGIDKRPDGGKDIWSTKPYPTLWGWWTVGDNDRRVIITEGEIDAMTVYQLDPGIPVLSMPTGASNLQWIDNDFHALQAFEHIYILSDQDKAGDKCAEEIATRLGRARCSRIPLPGKYKDANEALLHAEPDELEFFDWISRAYSYDPPTLQTAGDFRRKAQTALSKRNSENAERTFVFPSLSFQFRDGETTCITGCPGHGKSDFLYYSHVHEMSLGKRVCVASFEIDPGEMLLICAWQMTGHRPTEDELNTAIDWLDGRLWFYAPTEEQVKWTSLLEDFRYCSQRFGISRFIVDSLHFLCDKDNYEDQDKFIKTVCRFSQTNNVHTAIVAHANIRKDEIIAGIGDVEGSKGMMKPIDNGITIWRNTAKEVAIEEGKAGSEELHDGILRVWKQRSTGTHFRQKLWFDPESRRFRVNQDNISINPVSTEESEDLPF